MPLRGDGDFLVVIPCATVSVGFNATTGGWRLRPTSGILPARYEFQYHYGGMETLAGGLTCPDMLGFNATTGGWRPTRRAVGGKLGWVSMPLRGDGDLVPSRALSAIYSVSMPLRGDGDHQWCIVEGIPDRFQCHYGGMETYPQHVHWLRYCSVSMPLRGDGDRGIGRA